MTVPQRKITAETAAEALFTAVKEGAIATVRELLAAGVDVDCRDSRDATPLMQAAWTDKQDIAALLLEKGADIHAKDDNDCTPMMWASWNGHADMMRQLFDKGAEVDTTDKRGYTALMWLAENGDEKDEAAVLLLVEKGASLEAREEKGRTALQLAAEFWNTPAWNILRHAPLWRVHQAAVAQREREAEALREKEKQRRLAVARKQVGLKSRAAAHPKPRRPGGPA